MSCHIFVINLINFKIEYLFTLNKKHYTLGGFALRYNEAESDHKTILFTSTYIKSQQNTNMSIWNKQLSHIAFI